MPLDHYVSQVHLRNFASPALDGLLRVIRKSDLAKFNARSRDVCRIEDNSTNPYLREPRAIEEFLRAVEPAYNASVENLRSNKINQQSVLTIAGFAAYVNTCSPATMRIQSGLFRSSVEATAFILDRQGAFGRAPDALGGKSLTELLTDRGVRIDIDPKFPRAHGVTSILKFVSRWGNSRWQVLLNEHDDDPFFTSDFPVAIETFDLNTPTKRVVPLAPDVAVRIIPDIDQARAKEDLSFSNFRVRHRRLSRPEVLAINRLIVQCAEDLVFHRDDRLWIEPFVSKNRLYRIESVSLRVPRGTGFLLVETQRIKLRQG